MSTRNIKLLAFGGVNDKDTPVNFPVGRSTRCKNFVPRRSGPLRLRYGYTQPAMNPINNSDLVHTAIYYEAFAGTQSILFSQGTSLKQLALSTGVSTTLTNPAAVSGNRWGHFRANNKIHVADGTAFFSFDGAALRPNGIRAPDSTESSSITVTVASSGGSFSTTLLGGYQLYMSFYNPVTGHVGNRVKIGARTKITAGAVNSLVVGGLPDLSTANTEWVKALGRTNDGGEVPYWFIDSSGNRIVAGNTASTATITIADVDFNAELPTRNSVGSGFDGFAKVGTRIFAKKPNDPFVYYSEAEEDAVNGIYVGRPEESWPANNAEAFPTNEVPSSIQAYNFEGWFFSNNYLFRWAESLRQQLSNPWIGPYPVGCAGQRAFVITPYGPFWISGEKQLYTFLGEGPIIASDEYCRTLLSRIADTQLSNTELTYFRDVNKDIDQIKILGIDVSGNPVVIVHDFLLRDSTSPFGQAYETAYVGTTLKTFAGAGYTPNVPVRDSAKTLRCWGGTLNGRFSQLDDGFTDNGATYSADYISGPVALGDNTPMVAEFGYIGDENLRFSYAVSLSSSLSDFQDKEREEVDGSEFRYAFKIADTGFYIAYRLQLDSQLGQSFDVVEPFAIPLNTYGTVYLGEAKLGALRKEGR